MSRSVTRADMRTRASQLANIVGDPTFDVTQINALINLHCPAVYDELVEAGPSDYYSADYDISVTGGLVPYALPGDFMALVNVWVNESTEYKRPLDSMQDRQRQAFRPPVQNCTITLEYVPACPVLDDDLTTFDGIDGWDDLITARVARDILIQREGDTREVDATIASEMRRIRSMSTQRKRGGPKFMPDYEADMGWPRAVQIDAYRLRAGNIEIYSSLWGPFG